ncbi:S-formylglutathione hydrolase FrmB [Amycolatopsis lurida]|uniref:Esterase n=1 Tax=Amycolatopsis lurida NRRL 2430 TaxID=1460371 RepID=A0A2P2FZ23_AMYLU|nr:alpha/beta hydrolase family protein [Amycolatopsis lurida]KFU81972.1 hypothetical protein BB31_06415 [Amycolatopsis lurida NRRL 2430]SEC40013.1 S-formylglutathione hydrolase FrmB [Amycolatopsis lurida]
MRRLFRIATIVLVVAAGVTIPPAAGEGARVVGEVRIDERTTDLAIDSPSLGTTAMVRVLVPSNYTARPERSFPQLWLLHGCCADQDTVPTPDYLGWAAHTDVEEFTADKDVVVVMPAGGYAAFYSAWRSGKPDWETFHTTEVRQLIESRFRVNQTRAVAGLSTGGYGAMAYAFRHKGMFAAAASYSGLPNTLLPTAAQLIQLILVRQGHGPEDLWGSQWWDHAAWSARNPFDHVDDLRGTALYVSSGNGRQAGNPWSTDPIEAAASASSRTFTDRLRLHGIPVTVDYYGDGTHSWPYWERELHTSWPFLAAALKLAERQ